jgi:DNA-directed RNA polymerase specialized sigma24 family protein
VDEREAISRFSQLGDQINACQIAMLELSSERAEIVASLHRGNGISMRELSRLLGVSHVRIHQLIHMADGSVTS